MHISWCERGGWHIDIAARSAPEVKGLVLVELALAPFVPILSQSQESVGLQADHRVDGQQGEASSDEDQQ